ncbi:uncharacterized protein LOC143041238 [Oratosquilla oratoria]|uniref:uncharacterized protein LOC143041238 n=1 Tax=Oratosquilla oratoria TaxID=337810 RepID=UPI003F76AEE0
MQSDQSSNFTLRLFKHVLATLEIRQCRSTAFHPHSQGALERFPATLKTMLETFYGETGKDWDDGVGLLLFSIRDSVQESLDFSPFQLIHGHQVRGPLNVLKECWLTEGEFIPAAPCVKTFRNHLQRTVKLSHAHAQDRMKIHYD